MWSQTVFNAVDRLVKPDKLGSLNATRLDEFSALLRKEGKAEATIKTYLAHLRGCLVWAAKLKWIRAVPEFSVPHPKTGQPLPCDDVSKIICEIGRRAGVKVRTKVKSKLDPETGQRGPVEVTKFASAHDLRRAFGQRWSERVMPPQLMELMRHESISTTMKFYIGKNAERTADAAWAAYELAQARQQAGQNTRPINTFVNTCPEEACFPGIPTYKD